MNVDWNSEINKLPYKFIDPVKFDKKVNPKLLKFGSRIDYENEYKREEYYTVKEIISPEELVLNNSLRIKLLGVKIKGEKRQEAMEYLTRKVKNQKVFNKYDSEKLSSDEILLVYLYLKNKTFINAHLIKNGLADVDVSLDYTYKNKFQKIKEQICA